MTRYICDRCHRELKERKTLLTATIRGKHILIGGTYYFEKNVELCRDCRKKLDDVEEKLSEICVNTYEEFMRGEKR